MADTIRKIDYYYIEVPDKPGESLRTLSILKKVGVNLLAFCSFPIGSGRSQIDLVPEELEAFRDAAGEIPQRLSDRKAAFLIQGEERIGAAAEYFEKLATKEINVVASQVISAGDGRWGMILWVKPTDFDRASKALGI